MNMVGRDLEHGPKNGVNIDSMDRSADCISTRTCTENGVCMSRDMSITPENARDMVHRNSSGDVPENSNYCEKKEVEPLVGYSISDMEEMPEKSFCLTEILRRKILWKRPKNQNLILNLGEGQFCASDPSWWGRILKVMTKC
jgi:hypothetical protein